MQDGTRRKDSYIGHPLLFLWHEGFLSTKKPTWISIQKQDLASSMDVARRAGDVD